MQTAPDERTEMLKSAVADCFKAREPVNVKNVKAKLPPDFFLDFDTGAPLDDATVFAEIQSTYAAQAPGSNAGKSIEADQEATAAQPLSSVAQRIEEGPTTAPMVAETPDGRPLAQAPQSVEELESFPGYLPPSEKIEPVEGDRHVAATSAPVETTAAPMTESIASHAASKPGLSPQQRLDGARAKAGNLLALRPSLINAQRAAREAVALAVRAYQLADPNRTTPEQEAARFRETSQRERAARVAREGGGGPDRIAYVDLERRYSQGGDANAMARRMNVNGGNRRRAFPRQSLGQTNRDPSRGATPAPVAVRPTIPALAK
jgi:hypothetical protein